MEQLTASSAGVEGNSAKQTSLALATMLSLVSFSFAFVEAWVASFGPQTLARIGTAAVNHSQAMSLVVATAVGASLLFPLVHVAIASFFKSKRNPSSRRRIFIGWSLFIIILGLWKLWMK